jgi:hypothetical protein
MLLSGPLFKQINFESEQGHAWHMHQHQCVRAQLVHAPVCVTPRGKNLSIHPEPWPASIFKLTEPMEAGTLPCPPASLQETPQDHRRISFCESTQ